MSIKINISPEKAVQAGARWRVVNGGEQAAGWLGSGEIANIDLEPRHYEIEFTSVSGWKRPQALKVRNVDGFTNVRTAVYSPISHYKLGEIPPQTAWHGQSLEFMLPPDQARMIQVRCQPQPLSQPCLDQETGIFRYTPNAEDKFPFLVTLSYNQGEKTQAFEITPMPILPPEVDVFRDNWIQSKAAPLTPQVVSLALIPAGTALHQGQELPPAVPSAFPGEEPIASSAFLEIQPAPRAAARARAFRARRVETEELRIENVEYDNEPIIDIEESEVEERFNTVQRRTKNIRIIGENLKFEKGSQPYDAVHGDAAIKRLDIYAEIVTICNPLHLPQTMLRIYARELRFEDRGESPSYISTTPVDYLTSAEPATRESVRNPDTGQDVCAVKPATNGNAGADGGDITLHIESYCAPSTDQKRFILTGGRGQDPGTGLDGRAGISRVDQRSSFYQANIEMEPGWKIIYGTHVANDWMAIVHEDSFGQNDWPTDGENATPAGIPGSGGNGGNLTATLDLAGQADVVGGLPGKEGEGYKGGNPGEPQYSMMVKSWDLWSIKTDISQLKVEREYSRGWVCLDHPGLNVECVLPDNKRLVGHKTVKGLDTLKIVGQFGTSGNVYCAGSPLSWLQPLLLKEMVRRAKDRYLMGEFESAQGKLAEYAELLDIYKGLPAWNNLDLVDQQELYSIRNEIAVLIARLNSHLDYFGNPAGWVPMLSFEVNQTIFDNEIDRAIEMLYLTYWLRKKAQDSAGREQALKKMETKLEEEIEDLQKEYTETSQAFPDLEREASEISTRIIEFQEKLKRLDEELQHNAKEQLTPTSLETALKIGGTVLSVVPIGQPVTGLVGGIVNVAADFDQDDPWKTITGYANVPKAVADAELTRANTALDYELNLLKVKDSKEGKSKLEAFQSAKNFQKWTNVISTGTQGVAEVLAERQVPQSEVDALLEKLEAESQDFKDLSNTISAQLERNRDFAQKIAAALQQLAETPNVITSNLLALDSIRSALVKGRGALHDGRLIQHLDAMERRARERLLKYHYYLAKSYEYRLLRPYRGTLDLNKMFEDMLDLAELNVEGDIPCELDKGKFESMKGAYRDALSDIAEEILDAYQQNPPELSAPRRFNLTPNEVSRLNAAETVSLNLVDLDLFKLSEENVRIVDLEVESLAVSEQNGGERDLLEVDLRFEHSGSSRLRSAGRTIGFRHPARDITTPIVWGARYDVIDKKLDPIKPSAASDSLLRSLLKSDTADTMMLYSRPAAWADLNVFREVIADSSTPAPVIKALRLKVTYDYTRRSPGIIVLDIKAVPEPVTEDATLKPYFMLDRRDLNERQDGRGAFYRAYYKSGSDPVQIMAQDHYGQWKFNRWADQSGAVLGMTPCLSVKLNTDQVIKAVYKLTK